MAQSAKKSIKQSHPEAEHTARRSVLNGIAVSTGIAIGRTQFINRRFGKQEIRLSIEREDIDREIARLEEAVDSLVREFSEAKTQLSKNRAGVGDSKDQTDILEVYILICRDPKLLGAARESIRNKLLCAEWAWQRAQDKVVASFEKMDSQYLRERAADVKAVGSRVLARLGGFDGEHRLSADSHIIFAHDLTPADTLALPPESIMALATEMGGQTSHTGILARSMDIPCVVGVNSLEELVPDNAIAIVDGVQGFIIINPTEAELQEYTTRQAQYEEYQRRIRSQASLPAETEDGVRVGVYGNIELPQEVGQIRNLGGDGVGLYRTEFGYMLRRSLPTEEELVGDYVMALKSMHPGRVVLRTLDIGADKNLGGKSALEEDNPALGLRAIRYCLRHQEIFRRQLKAMLRASAHGNAAIMFPMISGLTELRQAKSILGEVRQELDNEGIPYDKNIRVGTMIELPAAVFVAPALAKEVDFFSIGTNDLIQYTLGIDRGNKYVSYLYQPLHPAIIQSIRLVVDAAHEAGITVCVCGEMASDPYCLPILLAMGIDDLSINAQSIPAIKYLIRNLDTDELRALLREVYNSNSARTTTRLMAHFVYSHFEKEINFFNSAAGRNG